MRGRRGYFFIIDAAIASVILFLGVIVIFGASIRAPEDTQTLTRVEDYATILLTQPLSRSTNAYYVSELLPQGLVPSPETTALEEIAYLHVLGQAGCSTAASHAYNFSLRMTDQILESQRGGAIYVNGTLVYNRSNQPINIFINRPTLLYVRLNATDLIGPIPAEMHVW